MKGWGGYRKSPDARARRGSCASLDAEHFLELSLRMKALQVTATTNIYLADEDLRDSPAVSLLDHLVSDGRIFCVSLDDLGHAGQFEDAFCPDAKRTYPGGVHRHGIHERTPYVATSALSFSRL